MYLEACKSFSFLVSPNSYSQSYYIKRVGKISNSMMEGSSMKEVSESSDNKNDNVERTRLEKRLIPSDSDSFSLLSSTKSDIGSKRAKIMIERIQDRKGNVNSSHVKPKINVADLGKISLCSTKKVNSMSSFSARGTCNICNELTDTAYAAKCGHIMCKTCWTQWLRVKESCPVCRAPASYQNIAKIVFKK